MRLHLNIGSNSGNRRAWLRAAIAAVGLYFSRMGGRMTLSAPLRSEPWGYDSPNEFLNIGLMIDLPGEPTRERLETILDHMQAIEKQISPAPHRNSDGIYRDREIDIDIITAGIALATPRLTLPHPHAAARPFVMHPLLTLDPTARIK